MGQSSKGQMRLGQAGTEGSRQSSLIVHEDKEFGCHKAVENSVENSFPPNLAEITKILIRSGVHPLIKQSQPRDRLLILASLRG
jgi:hypothetical protein